MGGLDASPYFCSLELIDPGKHLQTTDGLHTGKRGNVEEHASFEPRVQTHICLLWSLGILFFSSNKTRHFFGHGWPSSLEHTHSQQGCFYPVFSNE